MSSRPELSALAVGDPPAWWEALGFALTGGVAGLGGVAVRLGAAAPGIAGWAVTGVDVEVDGLALTAPLPAPAVEHPNGALGIDHLVVVTPDFARTRAALAAVGLPLRREAERAGRRQGFRRLGPTILELVGSPDVPPGPARFWGLTITVGDLDALAGRLGDRLGSIRAAVQPGRRIATLRAPAGLSVAMAFMDPPPDGPGA